MLEFHIVLRQIRGQEAHEIACSERRIFTFNRQIPEFCHLDYLKFGIYRK